MPCAKEVGLLGLVQITQLIRDDPHLAHECEPAQGPPCHQGKGKEAILQALGSVMEAIWMLEAMP